MRHSGRDPKPISVYHSIAAEPAAVWAVISAPGILEECHPFCAANTVQAWPGPASQDTIEYYNGRVVERRFTAWREGEGYDIEATDSNGPEASVSWRLATTGSGAALAISLTPHMPDGSPAPVCWAVHLAVIRPRMRRYLRAVVRGIEWRVVTGEPVARNQFGAHSWFSPKV